MSRRKQANPKSLRISIDSISDETKLKENETRSDTDSLQAQQEKLASVFLKNMTNQSDLNENRKIYQLAKLTIELLENSAKEIKKEPVESEEITKPKSRSSSTSSTSSDSIDVTTVTEDTKPVQQETKKPQRKRFNFNSQNDSQNSNSIIINGKRYYRKFSLFSTLLIQ